MSEHKANVSSLLWSHQGDQYVLFSADENGEVYKTPVKEGVASFLLGTVHQYICKCDSEVVQIDYEEKSNQLLVSTRTRSMTIDFNNNKLITIGKQPRNGEFGSVFYSTEISKKRFIYASRPKRWLWKCTLAGKVLKTMRFNDTNLTDISFKFLPDGKIQNFEPSDTKTFSFGKLSALGECLLTWSDNCLMLLDVESDEIIACYELFKVNDITVWKEKTLYILHDVDEIKITKITFEETALLERWRVKKNWAGCLGLVSKYNIRDIPLLERLLEDMKNAETADNQVSRLVVELENFIITEKKK